MATKSGKNNITVKEIYSKMGSSEREKERARLSLVFGHAKKPIDFWAHKQRDNDDEDEGVGERERDTHIQRKTTPTRFRQQRGSGVNDLCFRIHREASKGFLGTQRMGMKIKMKMNRKERETAPTRF